MECTRIKKREIKGEERRHCIKMRTRQKMEERQSRKTGHDRKNPETREGGTEKEALQEYSLKLYYCMRYFLYSPCTAIQRFNTVGVGCSPP